MPNLKDNNPEKEAAKKERCLKMLRTSRNIKSSEPSSALPGVPATKPMGGPGPHKRGPV